MLQPLEVSDVGAILFSTRIALERDEIIEADHAHRDLVELEGDRAFDELGGGDRQYGTWLSASARSRSRMNT
jgi:hypothetical protein